MSYAILITGQTDKFGVLQQVLIANHNNKNYAWSRTTNGGRGESNAWFDSNYQDVIAKESNSLIVGEILSTPLTDVDVQALENNERPIVLIQKLTKQFGNRHSNIGTTTMQDVLDDVKAIIDTDPTQLSKYRSDGRSDKTISATKNYKEQNTMTQSNSVIKIERTQDETNSEVIGNYVIRVPRKELVQNYIERKLHNVKETTIYDLAKANGFNVLIEGHAGVGKTSSAMNYAYQNGQGCYVASCSVGLEVGHLVGKTIIKNNGEAGWVDGVLTQAMKNGDVFVLDEIDFGTPKILQRLQDVLQNRTLSLMENGGEVVTAHPNFMLIATYNNGYRHSNKLNEALLDRFKIKLYFDYDETIEKQLIKSSTLLKIANQMRADSIAGIYSTPISLRILTTVEKLAKELNYDFAIENFLMNFNDDERPSVKLLLEAHRTQLEPELTNN